MIISAFNTRKKIMTLTTPALLFPAISLLLLAYTNRFLVLAQLIRELNQRENKGLEQIVRRQISNLRKRLYLIRAMQSFGVGSFIMCTLSMLFIYFEEFKVGSIIFAASLATLCISLVVSLYEVNISTKAIEIELESIDSSCKTSDK